MLAKRVLSAKNRGRGFRFKKFEKKWHSTEKTQKDDSLDFPRPLQTQKGLF